MLGKIKLLSYSAGGPEIHVQEMLCGSPNPFEKFVAFCFISRLFFMEQRSAAADDAQVSIAKLARRALYTQPDTRVKMDRYKNVRPFVQNRVKLQVPENTSDYVNASPITLTSPSDPSQPPLRYIATQAPTYESIDHVWRMVAEQTSSPAVIVQISTMVEVTETYDMVDVLERNKSCNLNTSNLWGDDWRATLSSISSEIDNDGTEKLKLLLHVHGEEEPRVVCHFLYKRWDAYYPLVWMTWAAW
jgi:protein tyrosine phosphatase